MSEPTDSPEGDDAAITRFGVAPADVDTQRAPQAGYKAMIDQGGFLEMMPGMAMSFDRTTSEFVLRNHQLFSNQMPMGMGNVRPLIPLNVDPPLHSKYRKLLDPLFTPRKMDDQEADITRRVNGFIDTFIDRGSCNFTEEFAELFPSSVFLGLCGLPEDELRMFLHLRDGILHPQKIDPAAMTDPDARLAVTQATANDIYDYFGKLVDERTAAPQDDMITRFVQHEVDGEGFTKEDILDICFLFVIAGLDTVSATLTCFYAYLAQHPEHRRQIVDDPDIIPSAVEELLRWETPVVHGVPRIATSDVDLPDGHSVTAGSAVLPNYGAANVDESVVEDPFTVRFDREKNNHLTFGGGVHRCLGSHLARRELRVALREWHRRIPEYQITPGHEDLEYLPGNQRHVVDLMLTWR